MVATSPKRLCVKATIAAILVNNKNPIPPIAANKTIVPVTPSGLFQNDLGFVDRLSTVEII